MGGRIDVVAQPAVARQHMGIVPQHNTLDRSLTVRENLVFHGRFFGMTAGRARSEADATLARVALTDVAGKPVQSLSGGMAQRLMIARAVVFPLAMFVPSARPDLDFHWPALLTVAPLAAIMCSGLGLFLGTALGIENVTAGLTVLLVPLMFLGCTFYPWSARHAVPWVQWLSLADPLTYVSEGFRGTVTPAQHLSLLVIYPVLGAFTGLLTWQGVRHFRRRIVS